MPLTSARQLGGDDRPQGARDGGEPPTSGSPLDGRRHQMFTKLTPEQIGRLRPLGETRTWADGDLMFEAGKPGPGMFVVLSGVVAVTRRDGMGHDMPPELFDTFVEAIRRTADRA